MNADGPIDRVPDSELDFDKDLIYRHDGDVFTGIAYENRPDGGLSEINYRDGLQDGEARDWYPSGRLKGVSDYRQIPCMARFVNMTKMAMRFSQQR